MCECCYTDPKVTRSQLNVHMLKIAMQSIPNPSQFLDIPVWNLEVVYSSYFLKNIFTLLTD